MGQLLSAPQSRWNLFADACNEIPNLCRTSEARDSIRRLALDESALIAPGPIQRLLLLRNLAKHIEEICNNGSLDLGTAVWLLDTINDLPTKKNLTAKPDNEIMQVRKRLLEKLNRIRQHDLGIQGRAPVTQFKQMLGDHFRTVQEYMPHASFEKEASQQSLAETAQTLLVL